jgi:hypothetical protein
MSEKIKSKTETKALIDRVQSYKEMESALKQEKEDLLCILGELYNGDLKEQVWGKAFSYTPVGTVVDESAAITQYCLENKPAEDLYISIQERKAQLKESEDNFVSNALIWHTEQQLEIPKKPRAASFRLNKGGMQ